MAAGSRRPAMIRASSFGDISRAHQDAWRPASRPEEKADQKQGRKRGNSVGSVGNGRARDGHSAKPHAATATNWNDFGALAPQVLLDRFAKGVEKSRAWLDFSQRSAASPGPERPAVEEAREDASTQGTRCAAGKHSEEKVRCVAQLDAELPLERPAASVTKSGGYVVPPEMDSTQTGKAEPTLPTKFQQNRDMWSKRANGFAGQQSELKSRVSRREAEALLQRLAANAALGQDLDEVRRLRKLVDDRSDQNL
mmetsp:Transcript_50891/g.95197  ORF Transcript_50891/g.95197 Transcript_50891/m.95197 type:complete len:253 (-) Transcript_50891:19-777(-)